MRRYLLTLLCLGFGLGFPSAVRSESAQTPGTQYVFSVGCRNGAIVPWIQGRAVTARVCSLELVGAIDGGALSPVGCTASKRRELAGRFKKGTRYRLLGPDGVEGSFEVQALEKGDTGPACGLVGWGLDELPAGTRPLSRYIATPESENPPVVMPVERKTIENHTAVGLATGWLAGEKLPPGSTQPVQMTVGLEVDRGRGQPLRILELLGGAPDQAGRFPVEGLLITDGERRHVVEALVEPARDVKTTRMQFVDVLDVGGDGTLELLLFERYRDGRGDYLVIGERKDGWRVLLRTGQASRRRYARKLKGLAFE